jgi:AcrR family transcriptional regulator
MPTMQEKMLAVRRQHVLDSATAVFAEKGFRGATIRDIAVASGVSDGTIYNLFENKGALLHAILAGAEPPALAIDPDNPPSLPDMIRARWEAIGPDSLAMLRVVLPEALIDPDFRSLYRQTLLTPAVDQLSGLFAAQTKHTDDGGPASYDARILTALFMGLVMMRLLGDEKTEQGGEALLNRLARFLEHGLSPETNGDAAP